MCKPDCDFCQDRQRKIEQAAKLKSPAEAARKQAEKRDNVTGPEKR